MIYRIVLIPLLLVVLSGAAQTFTFLRQVPPAAYAELEQSKGVAVNSKGHLFISDAGTGAILEFDAYGSHINSRKTFLSKQGSMLFDKPTHLFIDPSDNLYVWDEGLSKVVVCYTNGTAMSFGSKGSAVGQINNVKGLVADDQGFIYVLNGSRKQVDVFQPDGVYRTFFSGGMEPFSNPVAIGINTRNEICILEADGPSIIIFDALGHQIIFHRDFTNRDGVTVQDPTHMTVLPNGDLFILDEKSAQISHLSRAGVAQGNYGTKGKNALGSFNKPTAIACFAGEKNLLVVLDEWSDQAQVFEVNTSSELAKAEELQVNIKEHGTSRPPSVALCPTSDGLRYVIPSGNQSSVVAYEDTSGAERFVIENVFKQAVDVAVDSRDQLYVVDKKGKEVFLFNKEGVVVRTFGKDFPERLKSPTSIAVQSDGSTVVCDQGSGLLHRSNADGVYQKAITSASNSVLSSPYKIDLDSKDQIYIWDEQNNAIYRSGSNGWPIASQVLEARSQRIDDGPGKISGFFIDPLDRIFLFNATTSQLEMYSWDVEPRLERSFGFPGEGINGLKNIDYIVYDEQSNLIYCMGKADHHQKVIEIMVKPPPPSPEVNYRVHDGKLQVGFDALNSPLVKGYALLTQGTNGQDSIAAQTTYNVITLDEGTRAELKPYSYDFVSLGTNTYSQPALSFENVLGYADRLSNAGEYREALVAYQKAIYVFGRDNGVAPYVSSRLIQIAQELADKSDVGSAIQFMRKAFLFAPDNESIRNDSRDILYAYFTEKTRANDVGDILVKGAQWEESDDFRPVLCDAIDKVCSDLGALSDERALEQAIVLGRQIVEWTPGNPDYYHTLARNELALFNLKSLKGVPALDLEAIIQDAMVNGQKAVDMLKELRAPYFDEEILYLKALNLASAPEKVIQIAVAELDAVVLKQTDQQLYGYKRELASAYMLSGNYPKAMAELRGIGELNPKDTEIREELAEVLVLSGQYDEAKAIYQELLQADNGNALYTGQIGRIELLQGDFYEASFQLEKALKKDPTLRQFYGPLAQAYDGASNYNLALENLVTAIGYQESLIARAENRLTAPASLSILKDELKSYLINYADICNQLGKPFEAIEAYQKVIDGDPKLAEAHFGMGNSCLTSGLVYDASDAFAKASSLEPSNKAYEQEYNKAVKLQQEIAENASALSILDVRINEVYPSLYRNYADIGLLPVGQLVLANNSDLTITPTSVSVFVDEIMDQATIMRSPAIVGRSNAFLDLSAVFGKQILENAEDRTLQMNISVTYNLRGEEQTASTSSTFILHGRNAITWSDKRRLAAFVAPSSDLLVDFVKSMSHLFAETSIYGLNSTVLQAMQVYTMLRSDGYVYSPDPSQSFAFASSHSEALDFLQYPGETMMRKAGDCDDLVTLYTSLLENSGVQTAYIDVPGHVLMAFNTGATPDEMVNSGISSQDIIEYEGMAWIPVETTLVDQHGFLYAWEEGISRYRKELNHGHFPEIVPISDARKVYLSSSYVPGDFDAQVIKEADLLTAYDTEVRALLAKVNGKALAVLESRYKTEPDNTFVKNSYAALLASVGQADKAEAVLLEALDISPSNPATLNNLGNINLIRGNSQEAIRLYAEAAQMDSTDGEILINLCKAHLQNGDKQKAKEAFEKATSLDVELNYLYEELKNALQ